MKSIKQQYINLTEGKMSQAQFMRNVRMALPQFITNITSFSDTVKILKNKGILTESLDNIMADEIAKQAVDFSDAVIQLQDKGLTLRQAENIAARYHEEGYEDEATAVKEDIIGQKTAGNPNEESEMRNSLVKKNQKKSKENPRLVFAKDLQKDEDYIKLKNKEAEKPSEDRMGIPNVASKDPYINKDKFSHVISTKEKCLTCDDEDEISLNELKNRINIDQVHPQEFQMGIKIEMEHTDDPKVAEKIALDHLTENPFYYTHMKLSGLDAGEFTKEKKSKKRIDVSKEVCEDNLIDKDNGMKIVKGVKPIKASANKAKKEPAIKISHISLMSLIAQKPRGIEKMAATGEKMKKVSIKEMYFQDEPAAESYNIQKDNNGKIVQATNIDGLTFSINDEALAVDNNQKIKITGFIEEQGKVKAKYHPWSQPIDIDGLKKNNNIKPGVNLGNSLDKIKNSLKELIRKELREITGTYGGDAMDATDEKSDSIGEAKLRKYYEHLMELGGVDLAGEYKEMLRKSKEFDSVEEFIQDDIELLSTDDSKQADEIKQWLSKI